VNLIRHSFCDALEQASYYKGQINNVGTYGLSDPVCWVATSRNGGMYCQMGGGVNWLCVQYWSAWWERPLGAASDIVLS
jgi:hypothetical protein